MTYTSSTKPIAKWQLATWISTFIFVSSLAGCSTSLKKGETATSLKKEEAATSLLDDFIKTEMQRANIPGFAGAIILGDKIAWAKGYGVADLSNGRPVTTDTLFVIASVSKTMTGTALMRAVESGALSLDDDVNRYLPFHLDNPKIEGEVITPRHLATHTSTILDYDPVYYSDDSYHMGGDNPNPLGDFLRDYLAVGGRFYDPEHNFDNVMPGKRYDYSNIASGLAGYLLERTTDMPLDRYCKEHIFDPLGMSSTGWHIAEVDVSRHAIPYAYKEGSHRAHPHYGLATWPDGGLRTTVHDLGRFLAMVMNGGELGGVRILKAETVAEMLRPQVFEDSDMNLPEAKPSQAIFWHTITDTQDKPRYLGHFGDDPGTATFMAFDPKEKIGVIGFVNLYSDVYGDKPVDQALLALMHRFFEEGVGLKSAETY